MKKIQMVDLQSQYRRFKTEIDAAIHEVLDSSAYINGPAVKGFQAALEEYLGAKAVIPCANGTDALQIALMALDLAPGDEVIVPSFTYVATAEVAALLRLSIVMVDVDPQTFNLRAEDVEAAITPKTKVIVPVHLFGQSCDMQPIIELAEKHQLYIVEDNAQAIGADYSFPNGEQKKTGLLGHIGCTSFYPSKNLGAYGDGGAIFTNDEALADKLRMIANHGQNRRYYHDRVGVNSRLDGIQAALLHVKLKALDEFSAARQKAADYYDAAFVDLEEVQTPYRAPYSSHVFHQYTLLVPADQRDALQAHLQAAEVPSMIYYPLPLHEQAAFEGFARKAKAELPNTEMLCQQVISLPMHSELEAEQLAYVAEQVKAFFKK
ncbi:DegT/DnrJ/EryC1/StrS family aminotransferase [Saprospira sp. CCB-QB6]|uniref:DegT/DnrJ/EryC1/StrS family aminotransferase n=1 Tax=Saprospira sp. CCB-QB6 TaxID=3023936 RepID=UPI0023499305|nr:DegT/DnrJ/EryC1/StrS family aminotransferase [Saprospira sp. CCB-QB6]WCL82883.1 DegT/DnrJ/EryC1/StrS family aminotransferase [Saprospira sp. CCB-QB6]